MPCPDCQAFVDEIARQGLDLAELRFRNAELLEACKLAVASVERLNRHSSANGTLDVLRAAIAQAEPPQNDKAPN